MKKALLTGIAALSVLYASAAHAREWQGNMPKPVGKLPSYPPIVCVTPNWIPEPCEGRQSSPKQAHTGNWDFMDGPDWKALWDFLRLLDTSWVATADKKVQPW